MPLFVHKQGQGCGAITPRKEEHPRPSRGKQGKGGAQAKGEKEGVDSEVILLSTPPFLLGRWWGQTVARRERGCRQRDHLTVYTPFLAGALVGQRVAATERRQRGGGSPVEVEAEATCRLPAVGAQLPQTIGIGGKQGTSHNKAPSCNAGGVRDGVRRVDRR
ncbi:hypothetical protein V8E53_001539 [Lactarius tabidus]